MIDRVDLLPLRLVFENKELLYISIDINRIRVYKDVVWYYTYCVKEKTGMRSIVVMLIAAL